MMLDKKKEQMIMRDIVSPHLCKQLYELGVSCDTAYTWRLFPDGYRLWTYAFDPCGMYKDTDRALYMQFPGAKPKEIIPAFTAGDMENGIPGYLISKAFEDYELSLEATYGTLHVKDARLPDVFARCVVELLRMPGYGAEWVNQKIREPYK